jgi:hypothetical protein
LEPVDQTTRKGIFKEDFSEKPRITRHTAICASESILLIAPAPVEARPVFVSDTSWYLAWALRPKAGGHFGVRHLRLRRIA